jgi:poly(3-hydroxybutyrate) depolymerase
MLRSNTATESPESWRVPEALRILFGRAAPIVRGRTAPSGTPVPDVAAEGEFLARSYANQAGTREYRLYIPSGYRGQAVPLIVMLHGCKQSPEDFAAGTRMNAHAEERTGLVAYPGQAISATARNAGTGFDPRHQQRGHGEASLIGR